MFAIFENGGKQYKVSSGDKVQLEKFEAKEGEKVVFKQVLLTSDGEKVEVGTPFVNTSIEAKVIAQGKGDKVRVVKMKSKKRFHKVQGHRQSYTEVEILSIGSAKAPAKKVVETTEKKESPKTAAKAKTSTKKPTAKKA